MLKVADSQRGSWTGWGEVWCVQLRCCVGAALSSRWQRFDVEYRLPSDLPTSVKSRDGRTVYTARASITVARPLSRVAPAGSSWSAGAVHCWSPDVHFAVEGRLAVTIAVDHHNR